MEETLSKEFVCLSYNNPCSEPECENRFNWPCGKDLGRCPECRHKHRLEKRLKEKLTNS